MEASIFTAFGGQTTEDGKLDWPDQLIVYLPQDEAWRVLEQLARGLRYNNGVYVQLNFVGNLTQPKTMFNEIEITEKDINYLKVFAKNQVSWQDKNGHKMPHAMRARGILELVETKMLGNMPSWEIWKLTEPGKEAVDAYLANNGGAE